VLNPWNIDGLIELERETGRRVYNVLQLRLHPVIRALQEREHERRRHAGGKKREVELAYITSRGRWYHVSWKGDAAKSGGIATNIGVHFFDMLQWVFGAVEQNELHVLSDDVAASIGVQLALDGDRCVAVAVSLGALGATPIRARAAEASLQGQVVSVELLGRAEDLVREAAQPFEDTRGSVDYKRHLAGVLFRRAFAVATDRARGKQLPTLHV